MIAHLTIDPRDLRCRIRKQELRFGGNRKLKIYGLLSCRSGKRMIPENRVFFSSEAEALEQGYRPCGHCMKIEFKRWKYGTF